MSSRTTFFLIVFLLLVVITVAAYLPTAFWKVVEIYNYDKIKKEAATSAKVTTSNEYGYLEYEEIVSL